MPRRYETDPSNTLNKLRDGCVEYMHILNHMSNAFVQERDPNKYIKILNLYAIKKEYLEELERHHAI